jgi:hypothetical protein
MGYLYFLDKYISESLLGGKKTLTKQALGEKGEFIVGSALLAFGVGSNFSHLMKHVNMDNLYMGVYELNKLVRKWSNQNFGQEKEKVNDASKMKDNSKDDKVDKPKSKSGLKLNIGFRRPGGKRVQGCLRF